MEREFKRRYFVDYLLSGGGLVLLLLFVGKFYYLLELPLPLSYDESYYWDWSRALDWGYYSKPPMVAWLIHLSTTLLGHSEWAVRFPALLSNTLFLAIAYVLYSKFFGFAAGRFLLFTLAFTPIFFLYSFVMTIDPPLLFFWILSFYGLVSFLERPSLKWALFTGLSIGLGLLTKQTMFLFYILSLGYFFLFERTLLKKRETLLIFIIPIIMLLPNLYWNIKHQFTLIKHTEEHFSRPALKFSYYLTFYGGLLPLYGPFFVPLLVFWGLKFLPFLRLYGKGSFRELDEETGTKLRFLMLSFFLSFVPLFPLLCLSLFVEFNHNWLMPFFVTSFFWVLYLGRQKRGRYLLLKLNLIFCIGISLLLLIAPKRPELFGAKVKELFVKFYGWPELAKVVEKHYDPTLPLLTSHREIASSLAFYMKGHPHAYVLNLENRIDNQYHLWRRDEELVGREVFLVKKWSDEPPYLKEAKKLDEVVIKIDGKSKVYSLWRGILVKDKVKDEGA